VQCTSDSINQQGWCKGDQMLTRDEVLFCRNLMSARAAQYGYDVYRIDPNADGKSYRVELTSPVEGKRTVLMTVFEDALAETSREGKLAEAIVLNLDNELHEEPHPMR